MNSVKLSALSVLFLLPIADVTQQENITAEQTFYNQYETSDLKPGDVHPNAVYLEVDDFLPFNHGAAIVRKGMATAMIYPKGNFIIPFNKYEFSTYGAALSTQNYLFQNNNSTNNGLFKANDKQKGLVLINSKGQIISESMYEIGTQLTLDGQYTYSEKHIQGNNFNSIFINSEGKKFIVKGRLSKVSEGIGIYEEKPYSYKYQYKNLNDQFINSEIYDEAEPFSDGMAVVGKKNDFGQIQYGFIDRSGKLIIPFKYSQKPSSFLRGVAKVFPQNQSEFKFAFINKKGDVIKTVTSGNSNGSSHLYIGDNLFLITGGFEDQTGKTTKFKEYFEAAGIKLNKNEYIYLADKQFDDGKIRFKMIKDKFEVIGFIDKETKKIIESVFIALGGDNNTYFDSVAKLAYAKVFIGKGNSGNNQFREGYINEDGIFVIVKKPSSQW